MLGLDLTVEDSQLWTSFIGQTAEDITHWTRRYTRDVLNVQCRRSDGKKAQDLAHSLAQSSCYDNSPVRPAVEKSGPLALGRRKPTAMSPAACYAHDWPGFIESRGLPRHRSFSLKGSASSKYKASGPTETALRSGIVTPSFKTWVKVWRN
ncbi:hypothetical protein CC78DRAFT_578828 [Lojkania enalia]|uniref:Uncharacterized protein n=1 Tax=Lojkania enalia TaxID=147567 RepID=A0A9P4N794_9PLEO|nr:hypothetical protein CC78DRAFT_578828 [Didymosphaeria enalia]